MASPTATAKTEEEYKLDHLLGRAVSGTLANLFDTVSASLVAFIAPVNFAKIQDVLVRFLFDPGFQQLNVRVLEDASKVTIRHDAGGGGAQSSTAYPLVANVGDIDVLAQFFPTKIDTNNNSTSTVTVNALDTYFTMGGMPSIALIVDHLRRLIQFVQLQQQHALTGASLLAELKRTLPSTYEFAANVVDMRTVRLDFVPATAAAAAAGCRLAVLHAEVDSAKLERKYASLANLLKHLADLDLSIVEGGFEASTAASASAGASTATAPCMLQVKINYLRGGCIEIKITFMLHSNNNSWAWFSKASLQPVLVAGAAREVHFGELECDAQSQFLVTVDAAFRIPQLGCAGSISLPLIVCELRCLNSQSLFPVSLATSASPAPPTADDDQPPLLHPAARFDITILYMAERRLTSLLLRPFFNLDLLRFILLNHFHIQFEVAPMDPHPPAEEGAQPPLKDGVFSSDTWFYDAKQDEPSPQPAASSSSAQVELAVERRHSQPTLAAVLYGAGAGTPMWTIAAKIHMYLPIPPKTITSCLSLFVGEQIASPDNIVMLVDLTSALAKDLKEMTARLARREGDESAALQLERELREEQETRVHQHHQQQQQEEEKKKKTRRKSRWWFGRWF